MTNIFFFISGGHSLGNRKRGFFDGCEAALDVTRAASESRYTFVFRAASARRLRAVFDQMLRPSTSAEKAIAA